MNPIHSFNIRSRCGFCGLGGHNITRCNDPRIPEILNTSQMYLHNIVDNPNDPDRIINYRNYLTNAPMTIIKLLANRNSIPSINSRREIITILLCRATNTSPTMVPTNRVLFPATPPSNIRRVLLSPEPMNEYRRNRRRNTILSIMDEEFITLPPLPLNFPTYEDEAKKTIVVFYSLMDNTTDNTTEQTDCPICFVSMEYHNETTTNCNHKFCSNCVKEIISRKKPIVEDDGGVYQTIKCNVLNCPLCRTEINELSTLDNTGLVKKILKV